MNIKTISLLFSAILLSGVAFSQNTFRINGKVDKMPVGAVANLLNIENPNGEKLASAKIVNGRFTLTGAYKRPRLCKLSFSIPGKKDKAQMKRVAEIRMMLESTPVSFSTTQKVLLCDSFASYKESNVVIKGGKAQQEFTEYLNTIRPQEDIAQQASYDEANAWFKNNGNEDAISDLKKKAAEEAQKLQLQRLDFMRQHPNYIISGEIASAAMSDLFKYTKDELRSMADCIKNNPDTARVGWVNRNMDKILAYARGAQYTDFTGNTKENSGMKLSACMKDGAYMLVDFWASWCGPCRAAIPRVKKMYEKYNGKLQIVSVSVDEKEDDWRNAEKEEVMPWQQLLLSKAELQNVVARAYDISSIPRLVLISPKGEVLAVTHDPQLVASMLEDFIK